jgi:3-hydroxy-5-phosphonooxypentane-2,4-dione thiolase
VPEQDTAEQKNFHEDVRAPDSSFHVKGAGALDWGMKNRLARIFREDSGRTVMLAVDHGYFQGPTSGLERIDLAVPPLLPHADALMCTRGPLRATVSPSMNRAVVMRASGGPSVLKELSDERIAISIDDAVRMNVSALAVQVFIGGEHETQSVSNLTRLVDVGLSAGIPVMGVVAVGKDLARDARYFRLSCRMIAELGAQIVKCYYMDDGFSTVTASCPVPIVMAGGKKIPEENALVMASRAIREGAAGVDMGRNIFQSDDPVAMIRAVQSIVHQDIDPGEAYELFTEFRGVGQPERAQAATG